MPATVARRAWLALVALVVIGAAACSGGASSRPGASAPAGSAGPSRPAVTRPASLEIYAAASLKAVLTAAIEAFRTEEPNVDISLSTDSSAALETKIEQGAPADVFLSADLRNAQRVVDAGLAAGPVVAFATNHLTVIAAPGDPARISTPADLARAGVKVVAAGQSVPITAYAEELVANLARLPGYPADFAAAYALNVVSREDNVAAVVSKIALGEGDAAIVYETDARASGSIVDVDGIPPSANVVATYGGVVVGRAAEGELATSFLRWLTGPSGQRVLATFGFGPPA